MAEDVEVTFGASIEGLNASMAQVRETLQGLSEPIRGVRDNLGELADAFIAAFAIEKVADFVKEIAELGEQAERTSAMLGLTVEQVTDLQYASAVTGTSNEGMTRALEQLEKAMSDVHNTSSIQYAAFQSLGISTQFLAENQNNLAAVLDTIANKFAASADGPAKTAIAMALFSRAGAEMIPLLDQGADGLAKLKAAAEDAGVELSGPMAEGMAKTAENNNTLGQAWQGLGETVFQIFEPSINALVKAMTGWIEAATESIKNGGLLQGALEDVALAVDTVIAAVELLVAGFQILWTEGEGVIKNLEEGFTTLGKVAQDAASLNWGAIGSDISSGMQDQVATFEATSTKLESIASDTAKNIKTMFGAQFSGGSGADSGGPGANSSGSPDDRDKGTLKPPGQNLGGSASDATDAAKAKIDGEITVLTEGLSRKQALLNSELQMHKINDTQYVELSEQAVNDEYEQEVALLNKELQISGLKLTQRQELLNKLAELEQKHATDIQKIQQKAAADSAKVWQDAGNTIASAFNSQVSSLLQGSETVGQAIEKIGLSLATTVIENALKSVISSAAQAFAGTFAFLAPPMGPAAAGPAAASQAAVMAVAGSAGLAVGTWGLPGDTVAKLHEGEMVVPAFQSDQFRNAMDTLNKASSASGGGDVHNHFHGAILDGRELLRQLGTAKRLNPSLA